MTVYAQSKALFHSDRLDALRHNDPRVGPVHLQLILSDLCNQDCSFCAYRISTGLSTELFGTAKTHNPNRKIPHKKAIEILLDFRLWGGKAVQFTGGGEPTVHPEFYDILGYAQKLNLKTALVTNGIKLDPSQEAAAELDWVRVSVDAGKAETYAKIRRVSEAHFNKAWAAVEGMAKLSGPHVGVGFVVTPDNYREIGEATARARDAGADNIRLSAVFTTEGSAYYPKGVYEAIEEQIFMAEELGKDGFDVHNLFSRRIGELDEGSPESMFCGYQHFTTYVGGDLNVYRCCNTAYTRQGLLGSLENQSFGRLWGKVALDDFDARTCRHCQFMGQNKAIEKAIQVPVHVEFV